MATKNISATTELSRLEANIRERAKAESIQLSGINNLMMVDICFTAIVEAASRLFPVVKDFYRTTLPIDEENGFADISALDIASLELGDLQLRDEDNGRVDIVSSQAFENELDLNSSADLATALFARVVTASLSGTDKLALEIYRGEDKETPGDLTFTYVRNPRKETDPTKTVDFPDRYMLVVEDLGLNLLRSRLEEGQAIPTEGN